MFALVRLISCLLLLLSFAGCYAPLRSPGIAASTLPDEFRVPLKAFETQVNYAMLTGPSAPAYRLGPGDQVQVEIADLVPPVRRLPATGAEDRFAVQASEYLLDLEIDEAGQVALPLVGPIEISDATLLQARQRIAAAYAKGFLDNPRVSLRLTQSKVTRVVVLGQVARPDVYELPRYENDIARAIARAGGLTEDAAEIEVHRREPTPEGMEPDQLPTSAGDQQGTLRVLRIPLRSAPPTIISPQEAVLKDGDVIVVRELPDQVFFVVGRLSPNNLVRFSQGRENRDLGNGFVLPNDRDIDVVTGVAMAGYIDPIDSPTTVTVHRTLPDGRPLLIHVDLIAARYDVKENIQVRAGDIIYLNPDPAWWFRRTFDRIVPSLLTSPYSEAMQRWIDPGRLN